MDSNTKGLDNFAGNILSFCFRMLGKSCLTECIFNHILAVRMDRGKGENGEYKEGEKKEKN
jgi:hypothetical protein